MKLPIACALGLLLGTAVDAAPLQIVNTIVAADGREAPTLSVYLDGLPLVSVGYAQSVRLASAPAGTHSYSIRSRSGRVLAEANLSFSASASNGHFLVLHGDGIHRAHALASWPLAQPVITEINYLLDHRMVHFAPSLEPDLPGTLVTFSEGQESELPRPGPATVLSYGLPTAADSVTTRSAGPILTQIWAFDPAFGVIAQRVEAAPPGLHFHVHLLIGNGGLATPYTWLTVSETATVGRGTGSFVEAPVLKSPHFYASPAQPAAGLNLRLADGGDRMVGFLIGIGPDHQSGWQLVDGTRSSVRGFRLIVQSATPGGLAVGSSIDVQFGDCNALSLNSVGANVLLAEGEFERTLPVSTCDEYRGQ
ncbi:MAG: hypothetical protein U1F26_08030 [Lysobacterales bacterium]